ncbi:uncharacterized protein LOC122320920 [Drosophila ficusphila]|uniref:uncharacterized protein LOC122320920 n=1 Tax=Drosophila ficusphila TaxID=30025 RepID=UPI001C8AB418|nr:uncharacterized protein LOC122320920 [Drosophila ficusphila]
MSRDTTLSAPVAGATLYKLKAGSMLSKAKAFAKTLSADKLQEMSDEELQLYVQRLDENKAIFIQVHDKLEELDFSEIGSVVRDDFEELTISTKVMLNIELGKRKGAAIRSSTLRPEPSMDFHSMSAARRSHLPELRLPEFSGGYSEFADFQSTFMAIIDSDVELSNIEKLQHLKSCLKGSALDTVRSLEICENNYAAAWDLLNNRFNNKRLIFQSHINEILSLPKVDMQCATKLREMSDKINANLRALQSMGQIKLAAGLPLLQKTKLGWSVTGGGSSSIKETGLQDQAVHRKLIAARMDDVDDLITGGQSAQEVLEINDVRDQTPDSERGTFLRIDDGSDKTLGLAWDPAADVFRSSFSSIQVSPKPSKRMVLSTTAQVYDECVPQGLNTSWRKLLSGMGRTQQKTFLRPALDPTADGKRQAHLLYSKSRVAPLKTLMVFKLEFYATLLLVQLMRDVRNTKLFDFAETLSSISYEPLRFQVYVANPMSILQELSSGMNWRYVPADCNPADILTRETSPSEILEPALWFTSPAFRLENRNAQHPTLDLHRNSILVRERCSLTCVFNVGSNDQGGTLPNLRYKSTRSSPRCLRLNGR